MGSSTTDRPLFIRLSLPNGLEESLEGLAREVLRSQPKNLYKFAADHFERQLKNRNQAQGFPSDHDLVILRGEIKAGQTPRSIVSTGGDFEEGRGTKPKTPNAEDATELESLSGGASEGGENDVVVIGKAEEEVAKVDETPVEAADDVGGDDGDDEADVAATKIQAGYRGAKDRQRVKEMKEEKDDDGNSGIVAAAAAGAAAAVGAAAAGATAAAAATTASAGSKKAIEIQMPLQAMSGGEDEEATGGGDAKGEEKDEEEIDIDLEDPDVEKAATKIQAGFKGHRARKELKDRKSKKDTLSPGGGDDEDDETITAVDDVHAKQEQDGGASELDANEELPNEEEIDVDLEDPEVEKAASKIQAGYKGMKVRKDMKDRKGDDAESTQDVRDAKAEEEEEEEVDIDLDDPEVAMAATKIQAGYKGMRTRKEMRSKTGDVGETETKEKKGDKEDTPEAPHKDEEEIDIDLDDPDVAHAATKIQAGYKGMRTRKEVQQRKAIIEERKEVPDNLDSLNQTIEDEIVDIDMNDPDVEKAATKIQAGYKGMAARKDLKKKRESEKTDEQAETDEKKEGNEEVLDDGFGADADASATKIQAGYKGMKTRKEMKARKVDLQDAKEDEVNNEEPNKEEADEEIDIDLEDPEVEKAALAIQGRFKKKTSREPSVESRRSQASVKSEEKKDEVDIDLNDPDVEKAATKIQAGYKGMRVRKDMKGKVKDDDAELEADATDAAEGNKDKEEEEVVDIDLDDPEVAQAATKIQAGYKGMRTRKEMKTANREETKTGSQKEEAEAPKDNDEDVVDIDLDDPDVQHAATKIQAGYKGMRTRKELKSGTEDSGTQQAIEEAGDEEVIDIDLEDPEVEKAASKIQAGYKGMKVRKDMKDKSAPDTKEEAEEVDQANDEIDAAASAIQAGFKGMQAREELRGDKEAVIDDEMHHAATRIQAGYKGMQARNRVKEMKNSGTRKITLDDVPPVEGEEEEEEIDIDLDDPETAKAATKIQAGYKGMKTRKELKANNATKEAVKEEEEVGGNGGTEEIDIDLDDPETEKAATKIQAGYKGMRARKELRDRKTADPINDGADDELVIDSENPANVQAATRIQAGYRGMEARNRVKRMREEAVSVAVPCQLADEQAAMRDRMQSMELSQDEAASRIQAGFKGMMARKQVAGMRAQRMTTAGGAAIAAGAAAAVVSDLDTQMEAPKEEDEDALAAATDNDDLVIPQDPESNNVSIEVAKTLLEPPAAGSSGGGDSHASSVEVANTLLEAPTAAAIDSRSASIEVANVLLEPPTAAGDSEGPESLTVIEDVAGTKRSPTESPALDLPREEDVSAETVHETGATPFGDKRPSEDKEEEEEEDREIDAEKKRAGTAGSERMEEGLIANGKEETDLEKEAVLMSSLNSSHASSADGLKKGGKLSHDPIMVYHYRGSFASQKVLLYLHERDVDFSGFHIDLQRNEHLSAWFLEINPRGEVPAMKMGDKIVVDSTRILHHLEAQVPVDHHPPLVPCTSDTELYQKHVYVISLLDQIAVNDITYGLAFHSNMSTDKPSPPFNDAANLDSIRHMIERRAAVLRQTAEDAPTESAAAELRSKASNYEGDVLPSIRDTDGYKDLLDRTETMLQKMEEQLKENNDGKEEGWLLGKTFSAVDIALGVILNRFALLGYQTRFWAKGKRPLLHSFLVRFQSRPHFSKVVTARGYAGKGGPQLEMDRAEDAGETGKAEEKGWRSLW